MKQPFAKGFFVGAAVTNGMVMTKGRFPGGRWINHRDADAPMAIGTKKDSYLRADGKYTFDKLSSVFITGNAIRDNAPNHIRCNHASRAKSPKRGAGCARQASMRLPRMRLRLGMSR